MIVNYPDYWTDEQIDHFNKWVSSHPAFQSQLSEPFPDLTSDLKGKGLRPEDAKELAKYLKWLRVLPHADRLIGRDLLVFYYTEFQRISRSLEEDRRGARLCALFPILARMMFQGGIHFSRKLG